MGEGTEKRCSRCGVVKPVAAFYRLARSKSGYYSRCKDCQDGANRDWAARHPEARRAIAAGWRDRRREHRAEYRKGYYERNRERFRVDAKANIRRLKDAAYAAYGGYVCACCGETEPLFLCLDHVDGGGNIHRRALGARRLYHWLRDNAYPLGFQVLCQNCNTGKRFNGNVCPHKTRARVDA